MFLVEVDPGDSGVVDLLEEFAEIRASFVADPGFRKETAAAPGFENPDTQVDIFAEAHLAETPESLEQILFHAHIEASGIELVQFPATSAYASRGEERGHRIADRLLDRGEAFIRPVRPSEGIRRTAFQFTVYGVEVSRRHKHVRIQEDEIFSRSVLRPVIPGLSRTAVGLDQILQRYMGMSCGKAGRHIPAGTR